MMKAGEVEVLFRPPLSLKRAHIGSWSAADRIRS